MIEMLFAAQTVDGVAVVGQNTLLIVGMIIAAVAPTLASLAGWIASRSAVQKATESKNDIVVLKEHINSRMTELLEATRKVAHAAGVSDQKISNVEANTVHSNVDGIESVLRKILNELEALKTAKHSGPQQ